MINSNDRKLSLCGWLQKTHPTEYDRTLKLQKFLFFYEVFSKVDGEKPDFSHLRGYQNGPVFSQVWGDYTKERSAFDSASIKCYNENTDSININRAEKSAFIVQILSEEELSNFTHCMNLWKSKEPRIMRRERNVSLAEEDFNESDAKLISALDDLYPLEVIRHSRVISLNNYYFLISDTDYERLTEEHRDILDTVSTSKEELHNPVYVEIDEEGRLIID